MPTNHRHNVPNLLRTINSLASDLVDAEVRNADLAIEKEALELAYQAAMAYGRQVAAELAEVRANFAAARPVDSRDVRNARLRSM